MPRPTQQSMRIPTWRGPPNYARVITLFCSTIVTMANIPTIDRTYPSSPYTLAVTSVNVRGGLGTDTTDPSRPNRLHRIITLQRETSCDVMALQETHACAAWKCSPGGHFYADTGTTAARGAALWFTPGFVSKFQVQWDQVDTQRCQGPGHGQGLGQGSGWTYEVEIAPQCPPM